MLRDASLIPLSHQHHNALAQCVLTRRSLASDSSAENVAKLAKRITDRFEIELVNHFQVEERVLFPVCGALPIINELLSEHRAIESLVAQLRTGPTADLLEQFCELLPAHIRKEERDLFEQVQRVLPREVLDALGHEIDTKTVRVCLDVQ
jgi:hemerythrin-like domain-containing protein